jgi:hypothetical protein
MESLQKWQDRFEGFGELTNAATGPYNIQTTPYNHHPLGINGMWNLYFDIQKAGLQDAALGIAAEYLPLFLERADVEDLSALATLFAESLFAEEYNQVCANIAEKIQK